jgi:hypothetical protein
MRSALFWVITQRVVVIKGVLTLEETMKDLHGQCNYVFIRTALFWVITQRVVGPETLITNYHYPLSDNPEERSFNEPLKMVPTGCSETSVRNYHFSLRNDP